MPTLVSPGVSVTIVDESFFIPATAPTVPLFFIATGANKTKADGVQIAPGTTESGVVRTVTSIAQSVGLYGVPKFRVAPGDEVLPVGQRRQLHGDARNEYGLFALNQALTVLSRAFVVRADVDLADAPMSYLEAQAPVFVGSGDGQIFEPGVQSPVGVAVDQDTAVEEVWSMTAINPTTFAVSGSISGAQGTASVGSVYDNGIISFKIDFPSTTPFALGDRFTVSLVYQTGTNPLGSSDAVRRANIVAALAAEINSNQEVRSEVYEYNLIVCPGFPEVVDEMQNLSLAINEEAFVIADTPMTMDPDDVATWAMTTGHISGSNVAYYYPAGLASNLDGAEVVCAASGIALKTYAYSDSVSEVWQAPAGANRGRVVGVTKVGYVSGTLGTPTTFVETNLNQGQRDNLYEYYKNINPIVFFPGRGMIIWGQKTAAGVASALDRVNVSRMMMKIKRDLRKGSFPYVFEPNDQITRDNLKSMVDGYLGDILIKRGLYDFATLCDMTNNTPTRIDRNELWCDVALKPMKTAEFIYIPVRVLNTGDSLG
jgi:phage tail sheath protein FI